MDMIIAAIDFSAASEKAFAFAVQLAKGLKCEVLAVHIMNTTDLRFALREGIDVSVDTSAQLQERVKAFLDRQFETLIAKHGQSYGDVRILTGRGNPAIEIIKLAKKSGETMIVAGTTGRSAAAELLLGSTARDLIHSAPCPVVTVRAKAPGRKKNASEA